MMDWLAGLYVNILNLIQYMHDKYYYEAAEMALIDTDVRRTFATGIAGFSHVVDSLSAIKYAKVKCIRNEQGLVTDYEIEGDFPKYGNDDDRADDIAVELLRSFLEKIKRRHTYRNSEPTTSILTITSNVVYGKATGAMPDGRKAYTPFAPGGNPSYGAETHGLLASLNSVAKLPYHWALDGISNTQTINPDALGHSEDERVTNLVQVMDGYFDQGAHHLNVNVFGVEKLLDAMEHPEKEEYANFTIRVSGYAVKFIDLTRSSSSTLSHVPATRSCNFVSRIGPAAAAAWAFLWYTVLYRPVGAGHARPAGLRKLPVHVLRHPFSNCIVGRGLDPSAAARGLAALQAPAKGMRRGGMYPSRDVCGSRGASRTPPPTNSFSR